MRYLTAIFFRKFSFLFFHLYRTLPDCINYQSVFDIPIEIFLPDRTRRYAAAIDENHCGEVSGVSGSLTIFFYDIKGGYVVHIATIKLAADNVCAWSGQISRNAREILRRFKDFLIPFIIMDAHSAHLNILTLQTKFWVYGGIGGMYFSVLHVYEGIHFFKIQAGILASTDFGLTFPLPKDLESTKIVNFALKFSGDVYKFDTTWC